MLINIFYLQSILLLFKWGKILKIIQLIIISAVKFLFAPIVALELGYNYLQTVLITTIGGVTGMLFFFYLSGWIIEQYKKYFPLFLNLFRKKSLHISMDNIIHLDRIIPEKVKKIKSFTFKNKLLAKTRKKFGFFGIIIFTPILFSIPLGSFLAKKYYSNEKNVITYLTLSVLVWSLILSSVWILF